MPAGGRETQPLLRPSPERKKPSPERLKSTPENEKRRARRRSSVIVKGGGPQGWLMYSRAQGKTELDWRQSERNHFIVMASMAFIGMVLSVFENEILWYTKVGSDSEQTVVTHFLKFGVVGTTLAALVFLIFYYDAQVQVLRASGVEFSPGLSLTVLREARLIGWFLADLLVLLPQPLPFLHFTVEVGDVSHGPPVVYSADCILMALMFLRLWYLPRFVAVSSVLRQDLAYRMARFYNVDINTWVIMRSLLSSDLSTLLLFIVVAIFALSYIMLLMERPGIASGDKLGQGLDEFETCIWMTVVTITTVGLGDISPDTKLGRVAVMITCCAAIGFYALVVNIIVANVALNPQEQRIVDFVKMSGLKGNNKWAAATVIQTCWKQYKINCSAILRGRHNTMVKHHPSVRNAITAFRYHNRRVKATSTDRDRHVTRSVNELHAAVARMEHAMMEMHTQVMGVGMGTGSASPASSGRSPAEKVKEI